MTQAERKELWDELKTRGFQPTKHYRDYSVGELRSQLASERSYAAQQEVRQAPAPEPEDDFPVPTFQVPETTAQPQPSAPAPDPRFEQTVQALRDQPADTVPGLRLNTHGEEKPLRIDADGKIWYKDEITKASYPKERGKRVIEYVDPGVKTQIIRDSNGSIVESFEMPGDQHRISQARISLPAYQIGLYRDPALLGEFFKIHVYQDRRGFDLFDVERYFGGKHQIPQTCKRTYVDTVLCYDIDSVLQAIQDEYREKLKNGELTA